MKVLKGLIVLVIGFLSLQANGQDKYRDYTLYIHNIARNMVWSGDKGSGEFIIGVYGDSKIYQYLVDLAAKKRISGRKVVVEKYTNMADFSKANILFVPENKTADLYKFVSLATAKSTLILTESPGACKKGAGANLLTNGNKIDFELNIAALKKANLKINSQLASYAKAF